MSGEGTGRARGGVRVRGNGSLPGVLHLLATWRGGTVGSRPAAIED